MKVQLGGIAGVISVLAALGGEERVGMLLGERKDDTVTVYALFRIDNIRGSKVEFEGDPWQIVVAHKSAENNGIDVVGVFHTHPSCPATPSIKDVEGMKKWPIVWVIACPGEIRAWMLSGGSPVEVEVS